MIVTRGLGDGGNGLITRGHGTFGSAVVAAVTQVLGRARSKVEDTLVDLYDKYSVSAMLVAVNGDEIVFPKSRKVTGIVDRSNKIAVSINNFAISNVYKPAYKIVIDVLNVENGAK